MTYSTLLNVAAAGSPDSVYFVPHCAESVICAVAASTSLCLERHTVTLMVRMLWKWGLK